MENRKGGRVLNTTEHTEFVWTEARDEGAARYGGQQPRPADEETIAAAFANHPLKVIADIGSVADAYDRGEVRYPWGLVRTRTENYRNAPTVIVDGAKVKARAVELAERWVRTVGVHFDRPEEIVAELFDPGRRLDEFAGDDALVDRMLDLWREGRPKGEKVEADALARAQKWKGGPSPLPPLRAEPVTEPTPEPTPNPFL